MIPLIVEASTTVDVKLLLLFTIDVKKCVTLLYTIHVEKIVVLLLTIDGRKFVGSKNNFMSLR